MVTAEELSPFLDGQRPSGTETAGVNEAFVLPVLQRFRGSPVVSQTGTIVYHFPELQQTASLLNRVSVERVRSGGKRCCGSFYRNAVRFFSQP